jgi:hypothetical protein
MRVAALGFAGAINGDPARGVGDISDQWSSLGPRVRI